ncbi:hypothetical protein GMORB2_3330 [Geosmithia morbida]|uniref:ABC1 atypical kinase-like domain-containing protein n=1 Tax=Geosmithia morbida TaxID=1094350 RepID=A0A9P4YNI0_9HYPO|nr:uncharacterized protein GMORB2_3330 [Geosmithia morbida]KAF4120203.1 hypothetical protein GMORB2_3330 [Geosmithia morbida]
MAIDLAAVVGASRSVATKHVALRGRQVGAYARASTSLNAKRQAAAAAAAAAATNTPAYSQAQERAQEQPSTSGAEPTSRSTVDATPATTEHATGVEEDVKTDQEEEPIAPPGVDVNIFYTGRGSQILESMRKQQGGRIAQQQQQRQRPRQARGATPKEHPMRYWPNPPPPPTPSAPAEPKVEEDVPSERVDQVSQTTTATTAPAPPAPATPKEEPVSEPAVATVAVNDVPAGKAKKEAVEENMSQLAKEMAGEQMEQTRKLNESRVPSSRFSRLWNYGSLAAGMLGGAMTEGVSRAFGSGGEGSVLMSGKNMERLVSRLSRMRGAALKLGQMISFQDSKMLPQPLQEVLQRVQDRADYMPAWQRDRVLTANLGQDWRSLYSEFEETPIAAASIGQVHRATLASNGARVAVKVQFPGVADSINSDLDNLGVLLNATSLLPKGLYLDKTIANARQELGWECDYEREAACAARYKNMLSGADGAADGRDVFLVPHVYPEASGKQVLTMDFMDGVTVTRVQSFTQEQRDWIGTQIMRLCLREITEFRFMQTDPNWTNFLYDAAADRLVLLDFGASREFPDRFVAQYVRLLEAAARSDRAAVKSLSEDLGYLTGHESRAMLDAHIGSVLTLAEPFLQSAPEVYDFRDQTITERVKSFIPVMLQERLAPPPEETYSLHRKLSGAFLLCARLGSRVRCRELFTQSVAKSGYIN